MGDIFFQLISRTFVIMVSVTAVSFFSFLIYNHNYKVYHKSLTNNEVIVRLPKAYIFVGFVVIIVGSMFFIFGIKVFNNTIAIDILMRVFMLTIGFSMLLLSVAIIYSSIFFRIKIIRDSNSFEYRTAFGRTHIIRYDEIDKIIHRKNEIIFKAHKRYFIVDRSAENFQVFSKMLRIYSKKKQ